MKRSISPFVWILCSISIVIGCASPGPSEGLGNEPADTLLSQAETLTPQSGQGLELKAAFNNDSDKVRLMLLLSPT
jgi:hypothetical protein